MQACFRSFNPKEETVEGEAEAEAEEEEAEEEEEEEEEEEPGQKVMV